MPTGKKASLTKSAPVESKAASEPKKAKKEKSVAVSAAPQAEKPKKKKK